MGFNDFKVNDEDFAGKNIQSIESDTVIGRAEELKRLFDAPAQEVLKDKINALLDYLASGDAAFAIGAEELDTESGTTIGDQLRYLMRTIYNMTNGYVANGSITDMKLSDEEGQVKDVLSKLKAVADVLQDVYENQLYPIEKGGTGASTAAEARANLGALSKSGDTFGTSYPNFHTPDSAGGMALYNGGSAAQGAGLWLWGVDHASNGGIFRLQTYDKANSAYRHLSGYPNGDLVWNGGYINPNMLSSTTEYLTVKRYAGKPVYATFKSIGALPNAGEMTVALGASGNVFDHIVDMKVFAYGASNRTYPFPFYNNSGGICAFCRMGGARTFYIKTLTDLSDYTAEIYLEYTKA